MLIKKQVYQADRQTKPLIGVLLFLISIVLLLVTGPLGLIYGIFHSLFTGGFRGLGAYLLKIAISIDQLGNVMMQHLLNVLWVKKGGYQFGNRDETISSALGRNKQLKTLTGFGKAIDKILDLLDPDHSLNSIDFYIEPSEQIIDKLAWIYIENGKILSTLSKGKSTYYIPGGKREANESDAHALSREIKEELSVALELSSLHFIGIFEAQADGHKPGILVRMTCYAAEYTGELRADSEIDKIVWLAYTDRENVSQVDQLIFDFLYEQGVLL
ncbi:NUDIX domain-containing protein [Aggregatimonas sangjinii]|uniref:NUDIX domain-containing protein n=1 Tax=Aggregatimonas sangjinii TaxID=2583587 RepID=A0A5B7SRT1_9FLAO|nr:NUDIX domain-containing protein [Aggregatimonas sangjinii]QCX00932.1 NUDIX domain-containing protein [Aggregatimonas sangjinii]